MKRWLKLVKSTVTNVNYQFLGAYRLRVDASNPNPGESVADPNVFLYQRNLPNPYDGSITDVWLGVASPVDMAEFPVGEPNTETAFPFYRLDYFEIDLRSTGLADEVYTLVIKEVNNLLIALDKLEALIPVEEVLVGDIPSSNGSDSSGSSQGG